MKKIALVLVLLTVIGMGAFAQVDAFVYAEMDTSVAYDLDSNAVTLTNAPFAMLQFKFGKNVATEAGDGVYGSISVNNLEGNYRAYALSGDWSDLTYEMHSKKDHWSEMITWDARIVMGPAYLKIDGDETLRARNSTIANVVDDFTLTGMDLVGNYVSFSKDGSIEAGYSLEGIMNIAVEFGILNAVADVAEVTEMVWVENTATATDTDGTWESQVTTAASTGHDAGYALDAAVTLTAVENLAVEANFVTGFGYYSSSDSGFAVKVGYDLPVSDMTLTPFVAFDGVLGSAFGYDIGGGASLAWDSDRGGKVAGSGSDPLSRFFDSSDTWVDAGLTLSGEYSSATSDVNLMLSTAYLPVENLTSVVLVEAATMLTSLDLGIGAYVDYTMDTFTPHVGFKYTSAATSLDVGFAYTGISLTKIYANYINSDFAAGNGAITIGAVVSNM